MPVKKGKYKLKSDKPDTSYSITSNRRDESSTSIPELKLLQKDKIFSFSDIHGLYKKSLQAANSGFWIYSPDKNIIWLSDEFVQLLKLPGEKKRINNEYLKKLFTEYKTNFFDIITGLSNKKRSTEFEFQILSEKDNKQQQVILCSVSLLKDKKKNIRLILGANIEITERKHYEEELTKAKIKAEESDRIKTIFLTNISHEIRTPMNAIIGFNELLNIGDLSAEKRKEYLTIIKNKSKYLLSLIDDIAELSKFESGEITINNSETNLVKLLNELHQEFNKEKQNSKKQNVEIFLKLPIEQNIATVYTDPGRIYQVMAYLLDNALKFTEKGYIQFGYEQKDSRHLQFFVKDTGIGISKEAQKYLFNRFKIKEESYNKKYRNTGLGLTISRAIIEVLGGKIHVESEPTKGSAFYFTIPIHKSDKVIGAIVAEKEESMTKWRNKVILVAEDDEVNYRFIEAIFADTHAQLIHVHDGKQAVELCKTIGKIDLILMDIKMPEKSGYEAIKEIKKFRKEIPIIAQTAYTFKEDKAKCIAAGCDDYISKPIDIELLISKIGRFFTE